MSRHLTVLKSEAADALELKEGDTAVDATANGGGHSEEIIARIRESGTLLAIDLDAAACDLLKERFKGRNVIVVNDNFRNVAAILKKQELGGIDGILADLGWSSDQFEGGGRGFSFRHDEPLIMTYGNREKFTAEDIVNGWGEEDIANVLYAYGDERRSRKIAKAIAKERIEKRIATSGALAALIEKAIGRKGRIHPATKTFQALRIAVNDEWGALREFIISSIDVLSAGGRLAIITFHSGEDRIVKELFRAAKEENKAVLPIKKPIIPTREEIEQNPRARSAKLRILQKK